VDAATTVDIEQIGAHVGRVGFPYSEYWRRAVAGMLLSGRVKPKNDAAPNRTDLNRICKESNFNPHLFERFGEFLVRAAIVVPGRGREYCPGPHAEAFWNHEVGGLRTASRRAFLEFVDRFTGRAWRPTLTAGSHLDAFVGAFAQAFAGRAIREDKLAELIAEFAHLPQRDLHRLAKRVVPDIAPYGCQWESWMDNTGQTALIQAIYLCDWAYAATFRKRNWIYVNDVARAMLGLQKPVGAVPALTEFRVLPNLCIFAGSDLPPEKLVPLFRCCTIKRIDRVLEFQLNPRQLAEAPSNGKAPGELLADVLKNLEPLPATVANVLGSKPRTGEVRIRGCSAIVKPESPEVLEAIRKNGRLKRYLEAGAPPGYLLIKSNSNPHNFVLRCEELGFAVKTL
jgi:hypothetical protein